MAVPSTKSELLTAIETNYGKLKKELESIPPEKMGVKELEGHAKETLMSIENLLAYKKKILKRELQDFLT